MKSTISILIIALYILFCLRLRTGPWNYFQINARHFSSEKGIFSKLRIDRMIPERWKLRQVRLAEEFDNTVEEPVRFPVFVKPEWGQNAQGISKADNEASFQSLRKRLNGSGSRYIAQECAPEKREFEIYTVFADAGREHCDLITVTETVNDSDPYPINSINNSDTHYREITELFTEAELQQLVKYTKEIGSFGQSRLSVRANSLEELINGDFHVIELNLFTPMPLNVLDPKHSWTRRLRFVQRCCWALAQTTKAIDHQQKAQPIFTRMMLYSRSQKTLGVLRSFL